ncbi:ATP-binding protein [Kitasatospora acidiphila]|uniref:ATP-binding protein n=1 Tax=Kitasatospora acidiphila TaxID=2567942 RepID=UPI001C686F39|nr:hypothetical protein [Kitasatospora acidiphila]
MEELFQRFSTSEPVTWLTHRLWSVTNVVRHSGARTCRVAVGYEPEGVTIEVADDGDDGLGGHGRPRPSAAAGGSGFGLLGMRERVTLLSGQFSVDLTPAEIRRLLATGPRNRAPDRSHAATWSRWRRRHQAHARRCHYMWRGHPWVGHPRQNRPTHPAASLHSPSPGR